MRAADVPATGSFRAATDAEDEYRAQAMAAEAQQHRVLTLRVTQAVDGETRGVAPRVGSLHIVVLAPPQHGTASRGAGRAGGGMGPSLETLRGVLAVARMEGEGDGEESSGGDARAAAAAKKALAMAFSRCVVNPGYRYYTCSAHPAHKHFVTRSPSTIFVFQGQWTAAR